MEAEEIQRLNKERLIEFFEAGAKGAGACRMLGVELEHHVLTDDMVSVSYDPREGRVGVREILERLAQWYPEKTYNLEGDLLGLAGEEGSVTLEPAAQLELSAAPYAQVDEVQAAYEHFYAHVDAFLGPKGAHLEALGYHPTRRAQQLSLIPKRRYDFMNAYFKKIGSHGDQMMRSSASTQVSVDFADEADAVRKMRVSAALAPVLAAIADNTPVFEGEENHTPIRRLQLWREVDNRRCGTVPGIFEDGFGFERYAEWLLGTSPIFVTRPAAGDPDGERLRAFFDEPARVAYGDAPMAPADVEHLISMFWPDVRLKHFVEIRPADSLPLGPMLGYTALVKGIFYSEASLRALEDELGVGADTATTRGAWPLGKADVDAAITEVQEHGLAGEVYGRALAAWEELLFSLARKALDGHEAGYLEALEEFAANKPWWHVGQGKL